MQAIRAAKLADRIRDIVSVALNRGHGVSLLVHAVTMSPNGRVASVWYTLYDDEAPPLSAETVDRVERALSLAVRQGLQRQHSPQIKLERGMFLDGEEALW
jgi:ribosome-binding factor A